MIMMMTMMMMKIKMVGWLWRVALTATILADPLDGGDNNHAHDHDEANDHDYDHEEDDGVIMQRGSDHLGVQGRRRNIQTIFDPRFIKPSQILQLTWKSLTTYFGLGSLTISKPYKLKICPFGLTNTYIEWSTVISETIVIEKGKENVNQPISRICRKKLIATFLGASSEAKAKNLNVAKKFCHLFRAVQKWPNSIC